jgi:hypothetical protein
MANSNPAPVETSQNNQQRGRQSGMWREHDDKDVRHSLSALQQRRELDLIEEEELADQEAAAEAARKLEEKRKNDLDRKQRKIEAIKQMRDEEQASIEERAKSNDAADAWRFKNNKWISDVDKKHEEAHAEHREKFKEHEELHAEHKENHAQLDARVGQIEQKTAEHHETLQNVQGHGNWIVPTVIGLAVVVGFGGLIWLGSKIFGKKKGNETETDGESGREHARGWRVAPEVSGEHREWSLNEKDADESTDYYSD